MADTKSIDDVDVAAYDAEYCQDRPVCRGELRSVDLPLEHEDLMAKGENLGVTLVTGGRCAFGASAATSRG